MEDKSAEGEVSEPLTDEQLWGEPELPDDTDQPKLSQEEIEDLELEQILEQKQ